MTDILKLLEGMNDGGFAKDAGERMSEIIKAVEESGGKGALTLRLVIEPNDDGTAIVSAETAVKKPYPQRAPEIFFVHRGELHKKDPRQMTLGDTGRLSRVGKHVKELQAAEEL